MGQKFWIVGLYRKKSMWEFVGVFDSELKAVEACLNEDYFVGPATLNQVITEHTQEWVGCYYPRNRPCLSA